MVVLSSLFVARLDCVWIGPFAPQHFTPPGYHVEHPEAYWDCVLDEGLFYTRNWGSHANTPKDDAGFVDAYIYPQYDDRICLGDYKMLLGVFEFEQLNPIQVYSRELAVWLDMEWETRLAISAAHEPVLFKYKSVTALEPAITTILLQQSQPSSPTASTPDSTYRSSSLLPLSPLAHKGKGKARA